MALDDRRHHGFEAGEVEALEIRGAPEVGGRGADVIDAVFFAALEDREGAAPGAGGVPIEPAFVAPGAFGAEERVADVAGVAVVEIRVAGEAEGAGGAGAELDVLVEPEAGAGAGVELVLEISIDLFADADVEREAFEGADIVGGVGGAAGAGVVAEVVAGDCVVEELGAVVEAAGLREIIRPADLGLVAFGDVAIGEDLGAVAVEDEEIGMAAVGEGKISS